MTAVFLDVPTLVWIDPTGVEYPLTATGFAESGYLATSGVAGLGAAPIEMATDAMPRGGTTMRHIQPQPRLITLPVYVEGPDHATFLSRWRAIVRSFTTTRRLGPGRLRVYRPDGTVREIEAYYQDGADHEPSMPAYADAMVLTLYCPNPWWRATEATLITRTYSTAGTSYFSPYPTVSSSQTLGATDATNPGEIEAWPTWRITGPAGSAVISNTTTGESFTIDITGFRGSSLLAGETVTVVTEPPSVTGPDGSNWTGSLDWPGAVLWALDPGTSSVAFTVGGSGSGTSIEAEFYPLYETA